MIQNRPTDRHGQGGRSEPISSDPRGGRLRQPHRPGTLGEAARARNPEVRIGRLPDSSAIARLVGRWPLVVAAAPSYLEREGTSATPEALEDHDFIIAGPVAGKDLIFRQGDSQIKVSLKGQVSISSAELAVNAVRAGLGIAVASLPSFAEDLDKGDLMQLLPDWQPSDIEADAFFAHGQNAKPAARAFVDYLAQQLWAA